ncbi:MAG: GyrI-like domain-containing protein, partial [Oscillospiraceae bacterium]|nr:GyrI-like domain-containing protein [Oscillospiraceae bacterium]
MGSYDSEPKSVAEMDEFIEKNGYKNDFSDERMHHEIYLSDPRKTPEEKRKTVIRHPIAAALV